jgi:antirestriction protein
MTMTATTDTPRIYITCLASYNAGRLIGEWTDATDYDEIQEAIARVSATAIEAATREGEYPIYFGPPEEFFITDYENFGEYRVSEYEQLDKLAELGAAIEEHGKAFGAYLGLGRESADADIADIVSNFEEALCGEYDSIKDYAYEYVSECGWAGIEGHTLTESEIYNYLDWDQIAGELENDLTYTDGYIFREG